MKVIILFLLVLNVFANELNTSDMNVTDNNISDMNISDEVYTLNLPMQVSEENITNDIVSGIDSDKNMTVAVVLDKKKFFRFIPSILNSINAYMIQKDINYKVELFNKDKNLTKELDTITPNYKYIFTYFTNADDLNVLKNYPENYFFVPTLNKNQAGEQLADNIFFGGIDYKNQISKLNQYISDKTIIIYENKDLSKYITSVIKETLIQPSEVEKYPINYKQDLNDTFVYLNTTVVNSSQVLSGFTYNDIKPNLILSTQINYSPLMFSLVNPEDVTDLVLANSIFNILPTIDDNNKNLGSDINFNWLNYTTSALLNEAYNLEYEQDPHFLNDFNLYMFFNQIEYKTNLYKIFQNGFIQIEN